MFSIASLLDIESTPNWPKVESVCQYSGIIPHTIPHFSWQTAENYQIEQARKKIADLAEQISSFSFSTSGLGIFPNDRKILFLIIVKTRKLMEIHELLWNELLPLAVNPRMHYSPDQWIPHISLNLQTLDDYQFNCSMEELLKIDLKFEFVVNKFGILYLTETDSGIDFSASLKTGRV